MKPLTASCVMEYFDAQYGMRCSSVPFGARYRAAGFLVKPTAQTTGSVMTAETYPRSTAIAKTLKLLCHGQYSMPQKARDTEKITHSSIVLGHELVVSASVPVELNWPRQFGQVSAI